MLRRLSSEHFFFDKGLSNQGEKEVNNHKSRILNVKCMRNVGKWGK